VHGFVFNEPSGAPITIILFCGALLFSGVYIYSGWSGNLSSIYELLLAASFAIAGIAESLPKDRLGTIALLRVIAILCPLTVLAISLTNPEVIV
jgi:hypothetical protein